MVSDEELAAKIKYGDKAALDILVRRYHVPIHSYLIRMGLEYNLVDDIVQEVFIKLIRGIQGYDATKHFKPWLYTIASNAYKDHFKKAYVQHDVLLPDIADNNTCADDPEKIFIQQEEKEQEQSRQPAPQHTPPVPPVNPSESPPSGDGKTGDSSTA